MNVVQRAIIMAAGIGKRMHPITLKTPKPLVKVNGKPMIETVVEGLRENGIVEIFVVVGYLKEQFYYLEKKYCGLKLINNPYFDTCNNIASLYVAREHLDNAIIIDGDQIIYNSDVLSPDFMKSGYNCIWCEEHTNEWILNLDNGVVESCCRTGGNNGWQLFSISRWSAEDGRRLKKHVEIEFEKKLNRQIYWDDIPLFCYPKEYQLGIYEMQIGDVIEIDNFTELVEIDSWYSQCNGE